MKAYSPLQLLAALGALSAAASAAAVDTSQWKCETCPYPKAGVSGSVEVGAGDVSGDRARYGDYAGLNGKTAYLIAGGSLRYGGADGSYGSASAADLGLDTRSLSAEYGQEGRYALTLGYAETPHRNGDAVQTPFIGWGSGVQTLPAGFPAGSTAQMPLATTLQAATLATKRKQLELGGEWIDGSRWTYGVSVRHTERDGTKAMSGSFYASASQLVAPVNQTTDQVEVSAAYYTRRLQATLAYQASLFRNDDASLSWTNPFLPVVPGATQGQLALAPDNQFHQIVASAGYELTPTLRVSAQFAIGRMTQDAPYLAPTLNPNLVVVLPQSSLSGRANTVNGSLNVSAQPIAGLRLNASYVHNDRDNRTGSASYPAVTTDMLVGAAPLTSPAFSFRQDRGKADANYRWTERLAGAVGADYSQIERAYQSVQKTRESTVWMRLTAQPLPALDVSLKLSHADRDHTPYGAATWVTDPNNPLLRTFNLSNRRRDIAGLHADVAISDAVHFGLHLDIAHDTYPDTAVGLQNGHSAGIGGELSYALSDATRLQAYAQGERTNAQQAGSQAYAQPDWTGSMQDEANVAGLGIQHTALGGKLEIAGDLSSSRSRSNVAVVGGAADAPFPTDKLARDSLRLRATYQLRDGLWLTGRYAHERQTASDWHLDGVAPATVTDLLALGQTPVRYRVDLIGVSLRYRF